jgi:DNA-binding CsgD family transcriptional regulator
MTALHCKDIEASLTDITHEFGWDDFVFIFTLSKDWVDPEAVFVREASKMGLEFLTRFERLQIKYTWMQLTTMKSDLPQLITLEDFQELETDKKTVSIMKDIGWQKGYVWPTYGYGGALGFLVLYSRLPEVPDDMLDKSYDRLSPLVSKFNTWARQVIDGKSNQVSLSPRETECMLLVSEGRKSKEIAYLLNISQRTVEFHIQNAMQKLGGSSRSQAASRLIMHTMPQLANMTATARSHPAKK